MVDNKTLEAFISNLPDQHVKQQLRDIIHRSITKHIRCHSPICQGRIIGFIDTKGHITSNDHVEIRTVDQTIVEDGTERIEPIEQEIRYGLKRHRVRLDGYYGFSCRCGQDSSIAEAEKGIIGTKNVTREDIEQVYLRLQETPTEVEEVDGQLHVDGFSIETISGGKYVR